MKPLSILVLSLLLAGRIEAQPIARTLDDKTLSLENRYQVMTSNSQTYEDYKVIKQYILEGFWKIVLDTVARKDQQLSELESVKASLERDLSIARTELKNKEDSMSDIVFASTHISLAGRSLAKNTFLILSAFAFAALIAIIMYLISRMKAMKLFVSESRLIIDGITSEFDLYKRKSLEKEIKLSRELQTERNKVHELSVIPKLSKQ